MLTDLALCYSTNGQLDKAKAALYEAAPFGRTSTTCTCAPIIFRSLHRSVWRGDYAEDITAAQEAKAITQQLNNLWGQSYSQYKLGTAHF